MILNMIVHLYSLQPPHHYGFCPSSVILTEETRKAISHTSSMSYDVVLTTLHFKSAAHNKHCSSHTEKIYREPVCHYYKKYNHIIAKYSLTMNRMCNYCKKP